MVFVSGSKYPWERWADGRAWKVRQNADFTCLGISMTGAAYAYAYATKQAVATSYFEYDYDDDIVFLWFYPADSLWKPNFKAFPAWREEQRRHARRTRRPLT